jgi:hypothetical protein
MKIGQIDYSQFDVWPEMPEQAAIHTPEHPFCWDMTCYCHSNQEAIQQTAQDVRDGLLSPDDADRIYRGKVV